MFTLHNGDALEWMKSLPAQSVDCVFVDLPYFGVVSDDWDNQWKDRNEYLDWVVSLAHEWKRITKNNSSIFVFCDEKMEAYIQVRLDEIFLLLNKIVWFKRNNLPQKNAHLLRTFAPMTERALFYTPSYSPDGFEFAPLRDYFRQAIKSNGLSHKDINRAVGSSLSGGGMASHYFGDTSQFTMPTESMYKKMQRAFPSAFKVDYSELLQWYENLKRPFGADTKTWDVIEFPIIGGNENTDHPTTKPLGLYRRILSVITNQGQTVLDCCMGSGTAGVAALELGRHFLGCELKAEYFAIAEARIKLAAQSPSFFTLPNNRLDAGDSPAQQDLFTQ